MDTHEQEEVTEGLNHRMQSAQEWEQQGEENCREHRWAEAEHCFSESLKLEPDNCDSWDGKGRCLISMNRYEEAITAFDSALALHRYHAHVWLHKGYGLADLNRFEEAICCFVKALHREPRDTDAWNAKGSCFSELGCHEEALECYDRAAKLDPQDPVHLSNKAYALDELGRFEEALQCCDEALALDGHSTLAWDNKGDALRGLGRLNEALECYEKSIESDPEFDDAWLGKALTEEALGRDKQAALSRARFQKLHHVQDTPKMRHLSSEEIRLLVKGIYRPEEEDAKVDGPKTLVWVTLDSGKSDMVIYAEPWAAEYQSNIEHAFVESKTWGELRAAVGPTEFGKIMERFDDYIEPRPKDSDEFDQFQIPNYDNMGYPSQMSNDMGDGVVPQDILEIWGEESYIQGNTYWSFMPSDVDEINAELRRRGYEVMDGNKYLIAL